MLILEPGLEESDIEKVLGNIDQIITSDSGELVNKDNQGKRSLAYAINGKREGIYVVLVFSMSSRGVKVLENKLRSIMEILRYLIINI